MKVRIFPDFNFKQDKAEGGIKQVVKALHRWLPSYGVEIVQDMKQADLLNLHADDLSTDLPVAASSHGLYWSGYDWPHWALEANARLIKVMRRSESTSVPSRFVHNAFARGMLLDPYVLHHGVELDEWEPATNHGYVFWGKNRTDSICTPEPLNELARMCPDVRFLSTFGDAAQRNITLTGAVPFERSREFIRHSAVYLATVCETGGITVMEAAAAGVPALGFAWGANNEIVLHKETGYLVEPGDYAALKEGLYYCMEHRERLGAAAREFVREHHQWKDRAGDYIPFFESAIEGAKPHTGPTVSVIITAYNLEQYLPAAIESVLGQDFTDWECIIVDDASPDNCGNIADEYAKRDDRIKVLHNTTNQYLAQSRNLGIAIASGKYILPLDSDDELGPNSLGILAQALSENRDIDIVTGKFEVINQDGSRFVSGWPSKTPNYNDQIRFRNQIPYASMYRKLWWEKVGGYRRRWKSAEDAAFWSHIMSYGAVPAHVTDEVSLVYNNRSESMSHTNATPDWNAWYVWSRYPQFTPFGASGDLPEGVRCRDVLSYDPIEVSIVIPIGPGHLHYVQDAIDSCIAQTYQNIQIVCVNDTGSRLFYDTGKPLTHYTMGYPFVTWIDGDKTEGVASARNKGITASTGKYILFLDSDDYLQSLTVDILLKTTKLFGGWTYGDWRDQDGLLKEATDYSLANLLQKMPCSITCLFKKDDLELVGGFDEDAPGWEDYDLMLSLAEKGICGNHVQYPIFTYRYLAGTRREENYSREKELLAWIKKKHAKLYKGECE